jgi:hypothetical protein
MNSKVMVVADATTNSVISVSDNNPEFGYVKLQQTRLIIEESGFMKPKSLSVLIHGTVADLQKANFYAGQELPGTICVKESLEPFNKTNPDRDLKIAGSTGIVCTVNGQPIYRKTVYSTAANAEDTLVKHDNIERIRAAYNAQTVKAQAVKPNTDFDAL